MKFFVVENSISGPSCAIEIHILDESTKYSNFKLHTCNEWENPTVSLKLTE